MTSTKIKADTNFVILESHPLTFSKNSQKPRASKRREAIESAAPYARKRSWDTLSKDHEDLPSDSRSSDFSVDKWGQPANWPRINLGNPDFQIKMFQIGVKKF